MEVNAFDLVVLHRNVGRVVGNERFGDAMFLYKESDSMQSIEKLIQYDLLKKTNHFEISIYKIKNDQLKEVLKLNNLKTTGNKKDLIDRVYKNYNNIQGLILPFVYVATEKGLETLKDTKYLLSFANDITRVARAYYLAENFIDKDCEDKVAEIYKFEFQRKYENGEFKIRLDYNYEINHLIYHYEQVMKDYDNARKYLNIFYYLNFKHILDSLMNSKYTYYDDEGNLNIDKIENDLQHIVNNHYKYIYETLIYIEKLSKKDLLEIFKKDTQKFNNLEDELIEKLINYIVVTIKKENDTEIFMELVEILKSDYALDKDEFEDEYDYESNFITTNISTLKDIDSQIEVEIDIRSGKINFILDDDSLEKIISINNQNS